MHWENIQKRAQTRSNAIFAGRQGFIVFSRLMRSGAF